MNWKLFLGLAIGMPAFTLWLMWANTAKAEMPYPSAIYFAPDMARVSCPCAEIPAFLCPTVIPLPHPRPPMRVAVPLPRADPRK